MSTIADVLKSYQGDALLDAEVLLAHALKISRAYVHAFPERELTSSDVQQFTQWMTQRQQGMPVAYITGHREFWSLDLMVTHDTLIPRPETELLIELVLAEIKQTQASVADLGTGSGAIALALAKEKPQWTILATDQSESALAVAKENASRLGLQQISFYKGDWCAALPKLLLNAVVSNPPYIAKEDADVEPAVLTFEPQSALLSPEEGLRDLRLIIEQSRSYLELGGFLFLEHGSRQCEKVRSIFLKAGYTHVKTHLDLAGLARVTVGQWNG